MNIVYGYIGWNVQLDDEEGLKADVRDINALLKQLSPKAPEIHIGDVQNTCARGFLAVARDADVRRGGNCRIVGMATLTERRQLVGRFGYIDDVVVDEAYLRKGIAEQLNLMLIEMAAKNRHLKHLDLTSSPERVAANKLYLKLGYEKRETNVYRKKLC